MSLLRHNRGFRRLWIAGAISEAGDWLLAVALPVHVFLTTGSAVATSIVFLLGLVPAAVLGPIAGALVDRWDRRRTLVAVAIAQAVFLVPLAVPVAARQLWVLYAVMFAQTVLAQFSEPARSAFLPEVVEEDDLAAANGLLATGNSVARLVGAGAGGFVLELAHLTGVGVGDIASFAVSAALLAGVARRPVPAAVVGAAAPSGVLAELRAGFALIRSDRRLRGAIGVFALCGLAQGMFVVLHVVFILDRLGAPTSATGVLRGVQAVGGLVGGLLVAAPAGGGARSGSSSGASWPWAPSASRSGRRRPSPPVCPCTSCCSPTSCSCTPVPPSSTDVNNRTLRSGCCTSVRETGGRTGGVGVERSVVDAPLPLSARRPLSWTLPRMAAGAELGRRARTGAVSRGRTSARCRRRPLRSRRPRRRRRPAGRPRRSRSRRSRCSCPPVRRAPRVRRRRSRSGRRWSSRRPGRRSSPRPGPARRPRGRRRARPRA
ncbi:MAG: MFS transporter [Acidimicrobiia bacterium]|nr:MFS transporter [Acidimicrobiia bacterium]